MLLLAIPGMIGEAVVLSNLSTFMPKFHETSGGRYAAFLFATYALVLGIAEIVPMRAARLGSWRLSYADGKGAMRRQRQGVRTGCAPWVLGFVLDATGSHPCQYSILT